MYLCEVCGKRADKHHIIYSSQGGLDFPLNYKFLCPNHHRGKLGPHKNPQVDLEYKIELQDKLNSLLCKDYYSMQELTSLLSISKSSLKRLLKEMHIYKEGYKSKDIIYLLMGKKSYEREMLEDLELELILANF